MASSGPPEDRGPNPEATGTPQQHPLEVENVGDGSGVSRATQEAAEGPDTAKHLKIGGIVLWKVGKA